MIREWYKSGTPWIWMTAGAVSISMIMVIGLLILIAVRGLGHFWPADVIETSYVDRGTEIRLMGEMRDSEEVDVLRIRESGIELASDDETVTRHLIKIGNRDVYGLDFKWVISPNMGTITTPEDIIVVERREWGNLYGYLQDIKEGDTVVASGPEAWDEFQARLDRALDLHLQIRKIEKSDIGKINYSLEQLRMKQRGLELNNAATPEALADIENSRADLNAQYEGLQEELLALYTQINRDSFTAEVANGRIVKVDFAKAVWAYKPNEMTVFGKIRHYGHKLWEFFSDEPREANTEGGIFPAIFGTVMMVILMSIMVMPFGVVAAVYLREYATQGPITRTIRIAVNNLAGVPSIVYGVFGLGFFVYFLGGNIDQLFFQEALPAPTFGTPGLMWASLTLALLTVPVVIVATEEGLSRIPRSIREGSLALGATKAETLWRTIIPMASPAIMTGLILAIARAAGEVAPLMLVGVVKLAPSLPLDENSPFIHLDRKFMHLGFHIYDVGFQSPNVEAARPLVYATALLLVLVIVILNLAAIAIRNRLREKYKALEN